MKTVKKIIALVLGLSLSLSVWGCSEKGNKALSSDYKYEKTSDETVAFVTADGGIGEFMTDYYDRHIRSPLNGKQIHNLPLGAGSMFLKDWETMALSWGNSASSAIGYDGFGNILNYLNNIIVDKYGYTWQTFEQSVATTADGKTSPWGPNWPFPTYAHSTLSLGFEFNDDYDEGWTADGGKVTCPNGVLQVAANSLNELNIYSPENLMLTRQQSPFCNIDFRSTSMSELIDDVYLWWKTDGDTDWTAEKRLSAKEHCGYNDLKFGTSFNRTLYFPAYLKESWDNVQQVRVQVVPKAGKKLNNTIKLNYVRFDYDARQLSNNGIYLNMFKEYYQFTGDDEALKNNLNRARQAFMFLSKTLGGEKNGLISQEYFMGHDGVRGEGHGIGNGWWDIVSTPNVSFYANVFYMKALNSMIYLEEQAAALDFAPQETASIKDGYLSGEVFKWDYTADSLKKMRAATLEHLQRPYKQAIDTGEFDFDGDSVYEFDMTGGFWNEETGRFLEGVNSKGEVLDYGYVAFNLEAMYEGVGTAEQQKSIMDWIDGRRLVVSDTCIEKYGTAFEGGKVAENVQNGSLGIYDFVFAPRGTTKHNEKHYVWAYGTQVKSNFGKQVQNGGSTMYLSFYDIMARLKVYGPENAMERLNEIKGWYNQVQEAAEKAGVGDSLSSWQFYRAFYREAGINMQGGGTAGGIGLDYEFLEASVFYGVIPYGFLGLSGTHDTLVSRPAISKEQGYMWAENLMFDKIKYDVIATANSVELNTVLGKTRGKYFQAELNKPAGKFTVYIDGAPTTDYTERDGLIIVKVPFSGVKISVE